MQDGSRCRCIFVLNWGQWQLHYCNARGIKSWIIRVDRVPHRRVWRHPYTEGPAVPWKPFLQWTPPSFFLLLLLLQRTQTSISILNQSNIYFIYIHTLAIGRWASPAAWSKRDTETQSPPYEFLFPPLRSLSLSSFVPFFFLFPSSSSLDRTAWGCVCVALSKCEGTERCRCNTRTARRRFLNHTPRRDHLDRLINKETIRISVNTMMITAHSPLNESRQSSSFLLWMWPILYCTRKLHYSMSRQGFLIKRQRKFESCHILLFKSTPRRQPLMMVMGPITMEATRS